MKKLISIFGALTITATTTIMVVSCADLSNYNEIKSSLDKDESMVILISAEDCTHCKAFTAEMEKYNNSSNRNYESFDEMINQITKNSYNERLSENNYNSDEEKLTGFGKVVDKVTFKEYKSSNYENLFEEDWLVSLKDLIRDQLRELFADKYTESERPLTDSQMNSKINANYLNSIMTGTPTFLHFRNGRFIGTTNWDFKSTSNDNGVSSTLLETYVKDLFFGTETAKNAELWGDSNLSDTLYKKISETASTPETEE